jgi:hypothetical protein
MDADGASAFSVLGRVVIGGLLAVEPGERCHRTRALITGRSHHLPPDRGGDVLEMQRLLGGCAVAALRAARARWLDDPRVDLTADLRQCFALLSDVSVATASERR